MKSKRQTLSFLQSRFREIGIRPNTKHGQNFLIDLNLVDFVAEAANIQPNDVVMEVGTGTGSLTAQLAERAAEVITVEIDQQLHNLAREELFEVDNITFLQQDVLKNKNNFAPNVLDVIAERVTADRGFKLVANLPYNVATPVMSNLLLLDTYPDSMTVMIQKELVLFRRGSSSKEVFSLFNGPSLQDIFQAINKIGIILVERDIGMLKIICRNAIYNQILSA